MLIAFCSAFVAALANAAPTGLVWWDKLLTAGMAFAVVVAAAKAPRWVSIVFAAGSIVFAAVDLWMAVGVVALIVALSTVYAARRDKVVACLSAALAVQLFLRLPAVGFFGFPSLYAGCFFVVALFFGYRYARSVTRRRVRVVAATTASLMFAVVLVGGFQLVSTRADIDEGVDAARRGIDAVRAGNRDTVTTEMTRAERLLTQAASSLDGPATYGLRLVPVAAQHRDAAATATRQAAIVAQTASTMIQDVDLESISPSAGAVDLEMLIDLRPRLETTLDTLVVASSELASIEKRWLVPPLRQSLETAAAEIDDLLPDARVAAEAVRVLPSMLGADSPRRYLVIFGTPAESRELGGFFGSWAMLTLTDGSFALTDAGRVGSFYESANQSNIRPRTVSDWFLEMARPNLFPQNLTSSPDVSQVADITRQVIGAATGPFDGLIYLDAWALTEMLRLTGPVETSLQDEALTPATAPAFFFRDQYQFAASERTEIFDSLADVGAEVLLKAQQETLPSPQVMLDVLGPVVRAGRLQVVTFDDEHNSFLRSVELLRDFGRGDTTDFVGIVQSNALSNKMDLYLHRWLDYRAEIVGEDLVATATARLRSVVPDSAPEFTLGASDKAGLNRVLLSLYTPHGLRGVTVNGLPGEFRSTREFELQRYLVDITLPPTAEEFVIEFDLVGLAPQGEPYSLEVWHQPLVNSDEVNVEYSGPDGAISWQGTLVENVILRVDDNG